MPLHLLVKWEVLSPNSRWGQWESISNIYIKTIVVLASEPVGGRSRVTELPCFYIDGILFEFFMNLKKNPIYLLYVPSLWFHL